MSPLTAGEAQAHGLIRLATRPPLTRYIHDLWTRREFIWLLPRNELRTRAMNTTLGSVWNLLNPLMLAGVYFFLIQIILGGRGRGGLHENYLAFLVIGIFTYFFTQKTVISGAKTVINDAKLLQNINFPVAVLPVSSGISEGLAHLYAIGAMFLVVLGTGEAPLWTWVLVLPISLIQLVFNWGCAFIIARVTVHFRDTEQFLPYVMRLGLYLSGVMFSADRISDPTQRAIFELNPAYQFITLQRGLILDGTLQTRFLLSSTAWAVGMFVVGFVYFWRKEGSYANAI